MKRVLRHVGCLLAACGVLVAAPGLAGEPAHDSVADKVVNQSLQIQPGEVVIIYGSPTEIELMGALQVAVAKAGGQAILQINIPEADKRAILETPMEHLKQLPTAALLQLKMADATITVGSVPDPDLFADVPEERLAAQRQAGAAFSKAFRTARTRNVSLGQTGGIPTPAYAESRGANYEEMTGMFWEAVDVGPDELAALGTHVAGMLEPGRQVRLTSTAGTDLSLAIDEPRARINAGRTADVIQASGPASVWLPAGEAYACVKPGSASGTVVVPHTDFRGVPVENLKMTFEMGEMTAMSAEKNGEILEKFFDASTAKTKTLSVVDVGLNSKSQPLAGSGYASWEMGGMITVNLGNNAWAGGKNDAEGVVSFHLSGASLTVEDKEVVSAGKLTVAPEK
jgi:leucyl aminopeptidase (aminopeptidase T)